MQIWCKGLYIAMLMLTHKRGFPENPRKPVSSVPEAAWQGSCIGHGYMKLKCRLTTGRMAKAHYTNRRWCQLGALTAVLAITGAGGLQAQTSGGTVSPVQASARPFGLNIVGPVMEAGSDAAAASFQQNVLSGVNALNGILAPRSNADQIKPA